MIFLNCSTYYDLKEKKENEQILLLKLQTNNNTDVYKVNFIDWLGYFYYFFFYYKCGRLKISEVLLL